jgi:hypothetical protein
MIADVELAEFGGEVCRVPREIVSMNTIERAIDLQAFSVSQTHNTEVAHQECDIPILEEVYVVLHERFDSRWVGAPRPVCDLGSKLSRLYADGFCGHHV